MQLIARSPVIHEANHMSAAAKQASGEGRLSRPESARGLLVRKSEQIDGDNRVAIYAGRGGDRGDHAARLHHCRNVERGDSIHAGRRHGRGSSYGDPLVRRVRVAERSEEVGEIIPAPHHPWAGEDAREGLLDQVLGLVVRPAQRERDSVENGAMGD
jgi:hypothetical protein